MIYPDNYKLELHPLASNTGALAVHRYQNPDKPQLLFAHATGMCASAYRQFLVALSDVYDIHAPDLRGHGRTTLPTNPDELRDWSIYARDIENYIVSQPQPEQGWVLMGHSMGAVSNLMAAAGGKFAVRSLKLIEPVVAPAIVSLIARSPLNRLLRNNIPIAKRAGARRSEWADRQSVQAAYARKPFFRAWDEGVLEDYLRDGVREYEKKIILSCDPEWEQATFGAQGQHFWGLVKKLRQTQNLTPEFLLAEKNSTVGSTARKKILRENMPIKIFEGAGHLLPQEAPITLAQDLKSKAD